MTRCRQIIRAKNFQGLAFLKKFIRQAKTGIIDPPVLHIDQNAWAAQKMIPFLALIKDMGFEKPDFDAKALEEAIEIQEITKI